MTKEEHHQLLDAAVDLFDDIRALYESVSSTNEKEESSRIMIDEIKTWPDANILPKQWVGQPITLDDIPVALQSLVDELVSFDTSDRTEEEKVKDAVDILPTFLLVIFFTNEEKMAEVAKSLGPLRHDFSNLEVYGKYRAECKKDEKEGGDTMEFTSAIEPTKEPLNDNADTYPKEIMVELKTEEDWDKEDEAIVKFVEDNANYKYDNVEAPTYNAPTTYKTQWVEVKNKEEEERIHKEYQDKLNEHKKIRVSMLASSPRIQEAGERYGRTHNSEMSTFDYNETEGGDALESTSDDALFASVLKVESHQDPYIFQGEEVTPDNIPGQLKLMVDDIVSEDKSNRTEEEKVQHAIDYLHT